MIIFWLKKCKGSIETVAFYSVIFIMHLDKNHISNNVWIKRLKNFYLHNFTSTLKLQLIKKIIVLIFKLWHKEIFYCALIIKFKLNFSTRLLFKRLIGCLLIYGLRFNKIYDNEWIMNTMIFQNFISLIHYLIFSRKLLWMSLLKTNSVNNK